MSIELATTTGFKTVVPGVHGDPRALKRVGWQETKETNRTIWKRETNNNLTQWHPRWAKVDVDAGFTTINYVDEKGDAVPFLSMSVSSSNPIAPVGDRHTGAVYYGATTGTMYKRDLATGVVSVVWHDPGYSYQILAINEETGSAAIRTSSGNFGKVATSVEALIDAPLISNKFGTLCTHWINGQILLGNRFYDSEGIFVRQLPSNLTYNQWNHLLLGGNETDGYFIYSHQLSERALFAYDWETNTAELMFKLDSTSPLWMHTSTAIVIDSERRAGLIGWNGGNDTTIRRFDGKNLTVVSGALGAFGEWRNNMFQHINANFTGRAGWCGYDDRAFNTNAANTYFPGWLGTNNNYAGKKMLLNHTRLWNIVPK